MAKQIVHIGVAVATVGTGAAGVPNNGILPANSNIINVAAVCGDAYTFSENVYPQRGFYGESAHWAKHPDVLAELKRKPVPLEEAMVKFRLWLKQFQGSLLACTSSVDFWHLLSAFFATGRDCPFGTVPVDTTTLAMYRKGSPRPTGVTKEAAPLKVAMERWAIVTGGVMPQFGLKPQPTVKKVARPHGTLGTAANLPPLPIQAAQTMQRARDLENTMRRRTEAAMHEEQLRRTLQGLRQRGAGNTAGQAAQPLWNAVVTGTGPQGYIFTPYDDQPAAEEIEEREQ